MRSTQESIAAAGGGSGAAVMDVIADTPEHVVWTEPRKDGLTVVHLIEAGQGGIETAVFLLVNAQAQDPAIADIHIIADRNRLGEALLRTPATMHFY